MRRLIAIVLLAFLPLQFSWAAVASYCGHEDEVGAGHLGHHQHEHQDDHEAAAGWSANPAEDAAAAPLADTPAEPTPGAVHLDCGHCQGAGSVMLNLPAALQGTLSTAPPRASLEEPGAAHAATRPERPQWRPLA